MITASLQIVTIANVNAVTNVAKKSGMSSHAVLFGRPLMRMGLRSCQAGWSFWGGENKLGRGARWWEPIREGV